MSKFFHFFILCICFIVQELFSMNTKIIKTNNNYNEYKKNENFDEKSYIESPLSTYIKQQNVVLPKQTYKGYPITFDQFQESCITHYLLNGKPVAKLVQIDNDMYFESRHKQIYDFILQNSLNIGSLTIDANGKYIFQKPINAYSAYIESKSVNFFDKFSSKSGLSIETGCCSNHSDIECSNILFKGNYFKNRSNNTVIVKQSSIFSSEKILNNGNMQYGQDALINSSYYENFGVMHAYNLCLNNDKIFFNKGTVNIDDSFHCKSDFFDHQGILTVNNNCILEKIGTLSTSESSEWQVGKDWKAYVTHLYLRGYANAKNLHIISNDITLLQQSRLGIDKGSFEVQENITNAGQIHVVDQLKMDARDIKLEKTSVIKAKNADFIASQIISNKGILTIIAHWLAHAKVLNNSGLIQVDTGHIKADRGWLNKIFGIVQTKNGLTIDALISLNVISLTQAHNITLNTGISLNALGIYKAKNISMNSLIDSKKGLFFLPKINSFAELYSKENILNITKGLFFKLVPFCGLIYSLFNNTKNIYSNSRLLYDQTRSLYDQKYKGMSDIIALACGIKNVIMSGKQVNYLGKQGYQVLLKLKDVDNYQEVAQKNIQDTVVTPIKNVISKVKDIDSFQKVTQTIQDNAIPIKNNLKEISEDVVVQIVPHVNRDTVIDLNYGVIGGIDHSNSIYNINIASLFFQNIMNTRDGYNFGYLGAYNLNINATDSYSTGGFIKSFNASIETKRLIVDGKVNVLGNTLLKGKEYASIGANIKTQQIGIQSDDIVAIKKESVVDASNVCIDSQEVWQKGIVKTKHLGVDAHFIDNHGTTETSTMCITRSKPREYGRHSAKKNGLFNHGILKTSDLYADVENVQLDKNSQFCSKGAHFKSDFDFENNGQMKTEKSIIEVENQVINTGNINSEELRIIKAKNVSCTKTSTIVSQDAFIKADENVILDGITQIARGSVDANGKITTIGTLGSSQLDMKAKDIIFEKTANVASKIATLTANGKVHFDGMIQIDRGFVDAKDKITTVRKLGSSQQLEMKAKDIIFEKTADITAKIADLKANETIDNQGTFLSSVLLTHSKYMTNSGEIISDNAHIKADRYFLNKWEGRIKVHKELTVDTLILLNLFGYIDAESLNTNSIIDINLYGIYRASSSNMNSFIGYNTGILLPKFQSLQKICSANNIKKLYKSLRNGMPLIGIYYKIKNIPKSINKYCKNVQCLWKRAQDLYTNENTCASEVVPVLCQAKNMIFSAMQTGYQGYQMNQDVCNKKSFSQFDESNKKYVPGSIADLWQTEKNNAIAQTVSYLHSNIIEHPIVNSAISVFGPQLTRNSLLDNNNGLMLGINGSSQSLYNVNSGAAYFANNYSINTLFGINSGLLGARNLSVNASQTYTNTGLLSGINSTISANDLLTTGTIYAFNNALLRVHNNAVIDRNIKANQIAINAKHVELKKDAYIASQVNTCVKADKIINQAKVRSNSVNFEGKEVSLQNGSDIQTHGDINQIIIKAENSLEANKDSSIRGNFVKIDAPNVDIDHNGFLKANTLNIDGKNVFASKTSHIEIENGEFNIEEKTVNAGTLVLQNMTLNTKEVVLTETSDVKLNNIQANVSETIHNAGTAQFNNVCINSKNIETAETSNITVANGEFTVEEKIVNAGRLTLQDSVVNTKETILTETSDVKLNNIQANVNETIHNAGAVQANNVCINSKNIETAETSNITVANGEFTVEEKIVNAGRLALQNSVVNTKEAILTETSDVKLNNVQANVNEKIYNAGTAQFNNVCINSKNIETAETSNISVEKYLILQAKCIDNSGVVEGDTIITKADLLNLRKTSKINANIFSNDIKEIHGEKGNTIAVKNYASMKTNYVDNEGSVQGPLLVQFTGNSDDLKRIGQVQNLQYSGILENDIADKLADGHNDLLDVQKGGSVCIDAEQQNVHVKQKHEMAHTFQVKTDNSIQCDQELKSDNSILLIAKQNVQHESIISKELAALIGKNITSLSHIEREYNGENYEDKCNRNKVAGDQVIIQTQENLNHLATDVESKGGGNHIFIGGNLYCDSLELEKYIKSESTTKSLLGFEKTTTTVEDIYKQQEVTKFKSEGVNNINVGGKCYLPGTVFDAKGGTTITHNGIEDYSTYNTHIHKEEIKTKYTVFNKEFDSETTYKESISIEEKPLAFLEKVIPVINSNEKVSLSFICNAPKLIINAPEVNYIIPKNIKTTMSFKDKIHKLIWNRVTQDDSIDITYSPKYTGVIETDAQKIHLEGIQGCSTTRVKATNKNAEIIRSKIEEKHENQRTVLRSRPTKPLMFAICFAVSIATANIGGSLGSGIAALSNSKVAISLLPNIVSSGLSSLSTQTTQILLNSDGNIKQAMHQWVSKDTFKNLLVSVLSSGAMVGVEHIFNKVVLQPINSGSFAKRCISQAPRQLTYAGIKTAADIAMGKNTKKAVKDNLKLSLANIVGIAASGRIGDAYINNKINSITHKFLHTGVGALEGFIINNVDGAIAGAIGSGLAETVADVFGPKLPSLDYIKQLERKRGNSLTQEEFIGEWNLQIARYLKNTYTTAEAAKFIGATAALLAQKDMDIAYNTAAKAIDNNFLLLATYGIAGASAAYSIYEIYNTYQEKGADAAFERLGIEVKYNVAGYVAGRAVGSVFFKVGNMLYPSAQAAVTAVLDSAPGLKYALGGMKDTLIAAGEKCAQTTLGKQAAYIGDCINKIETQLIKSEQKVIQKISQKVEATTNSIKNTIKSPRNKHKTLATAEGTSIRFLDESVSTTKVEQEFTQKMDMFDGGDSKIFNKINHTKQQSSLPIEELIEHLDAGTQYKTASIVIDKSMTKIPSKELAKLISDQSPTILQSIKSQLIDLINGGNKIKEVADKVFKVEHTFSPKHIDNGIFKLGEIPEKITEKCIKIIKKADSLNKLIEGTNVIRTYNNGIPIEIHVHVQGNLLRSFNFFVEHSNRIGKNIIELF